MSPTRKKPADRAGVHDRKSERFVSVLGQYNCDEVEYEFVIPIASFDAKQFHQAIGMPLEGLRWSGTTPPKVLSTAYHVHFKGMVDKKTARLTVEYADGAIKKASAEEPEPFAESIMGWLGQFVREPSFRATTIARFKKPPDKWRSRFNLPFRVTMGSDEVTIDGVSLVLPKNKVGARNAFLGTSDASILAVVHAFRSIEFARFDLASEVRSLNEAVQIFVEQIP